MVMGKPTCQRGSPVGTRRFRVQPSVSSHADHCAARAVTDIYGALYRSGYTGAPLDAFIIRLVVGLFVDAEAVRRCAAMARRSGRDLGVQIGRVAELIWLAPDSRPAGLAAPWTSLPSVPPDPSPAWSPPVRVPARARPLLRACLAAPWADASPMLIADVYRAMLHVQVDEDGQPPARSSRHDTDAVHAQRLLGPLFLDDLERCLDEAGTDPVRLRVLLAHLCGLRCFDPASGCGNLLVVAYAAVRQMETSIRTRLAAADPAWAADEAAGRAGPGIRSELAVGIEIDPMPVWISRIALALVEQRSDAQLAAALPSSRTGNSPSSSLRMPTSVHLGNALAMDWAEVCPRPQCTPFSGTGRTAGAPSTDAPAVTAVHVATNPPFVGTQQRTPAQRTELARICRDLPRQGDLDYATAWFVLAAAYITDQPITAGFIVSANRITGVQGHGLWAYLARLGIGIRFACRPTRWRSKAIANPQVMVAIVGIAHGPVPAGTTLRLAEVGRATGATTVRHVARIGPDLTDLPDIAVPHRDEPPPGVPPACAGDAAADDGHLILSVAERAVLLKRHPRAQKYLRPYVTPISLLNGEPLWCLWLDEDDRGWLAMPAIAARVEAVRAVRAAKQGRVQRISTAPPHRFAFHRAVFSPGIVIPRCASERRITIPMVMVGADAVVGTGCAIIPGGMEEHLGVLMSAMHQAWTRQCAGRQEQRLRYAIRTVYNTFPWPMIDGQWDPVARERIAAATREILAVRAQHQTATGASLAKLYQSGAMPSDLRAAHEALSAAVDAAYDPNRRWTDDRSRVEYLVTEQRRRLGMLGVEAPAAAPLRTPTPAAHVLSA